MVRGAGAAAPRDLTRPAPPPEPTLGYLARRGLPSIAFEGIVPLGLFYAGLKAGGLALGIALSSGAAAAVLVWEIRAGRQGLLARLSLAFVAVQATVGLLSHSETVYLAQPVVANGIWGLAFLLSVPLRRPLAGTFAQVWYPFRDEQRAHPLFTRVFGTVSIVWGVYLLARSALRLVALLEGGLLGFAVVTFATGTPIFLLLMAWSVWYSRRRLTRG